MQASGKKTCFQFPERSLAYAKVVEKNEYRQCLHAIIAPALAIPSSSTEIRRRIVRCLSVSFVVVFLGAYAVCDILFVRNPCHSFEKVLMFMDYSLEKVWCLRIIRLKKCNFVIEVTRLRHA